MFSLASKEFNSRLIVGTGKFASGDQMMACLYSSGSELVSVPIRRIDVSNNNQEGSLRVLVERDFNILLDTSGAKTADEAITAAVKARKEVGSNWVRLVIHPEQKYLFPDPIETVKAAEHLVREGFIVLPYIHMDPVICKRLEEVGCAAVMPFVAPIGALKPLIASDTMTQIIERAQVPILLGAGCASPSDASYALELGFDGVFTHTAIAAALNPIDMANAFKLAVDSGRSAYEAGLAVRSVQRVSTTPIKSYLGG